MTHRQLLLSQFFVLTLLAVLFHVGLALRWYMLAPFDVLLHFLGGLWASLALFWGSARFGYPIKSTYVFVGVMVIGAGWEVFEFIFDISGGLKDTVADFALDATGALIGIFGVKALASKKEIV